MSNFNGIYDEWLNFLDTLEKGKKNLTKLVPVQKQITRKGKTYTTTVYVSPGEAEKHDAASPKQFADFSVPKGKIPAVEVQKHLRPIRKILGTDRYKEYLEACGVKWEKNSENAAADTMRASSAAKKFLEGGGQLDVGLFEHMKNGGSVASFKKKGEPKLVVADKPKAPKPKPAPKVEPEPEAPKELDSDEKIKNASSQKEIADILKKTHSMNQVELGAMDLKTAKMAALEVDRMMKKFPAMKNNSLRNFGTHKEVRKAVIDQISGMWGIDFGKQIGNNLKMTKNTHAYHVSWSSPAVAKYGNGIHLNNGIFSEPYIKQGQAKLKELKATSWLATGSARGTIVHEIGHAVHKAYDKDITPKLKEIMKSYTAVKIEVGLSRYAKTQFDEFVAEAFAEYYTSSNPRPIAKKVGAVFEEVAAIKNKNKWEV